MQITVYTIVKLTDGKKYARSKVFFTRKIIIFFRKIPQWEKKVLLRYLFFHCRTNSCLGTIDPALCPVKWAGKQCRLLHTEELELFWYASACALRTN